MASRGLYYAHRLLHGSIINRHGILSSVIENSHKTQITASVSYSQLPLRSFVTSEARFSWFDSVKSFFGGKTKTTSDSKTEKTDESDAAASASSSSFTLLKYADEIKKARRLGSLAQLVQGRASEATVSKAFEKNEAIIRALADYDPTGEHLNSTHKTEAAKQCSCTITEVEDALSKFTWAKQAEMKIKKLKADGKSLPTTLAEVQELVGTTPMKIANANLSDKRSKVVKAYANLANENAAKAGIISRNQLCPCGSKKKYKRFLILVHRNCLFDLLLYLR